MTDVDPNSKRTALHVAACEGRDELVKFLLENSADITAKDSKGNTPLNDAVRHHQDSTARVLRGHAPGISLAMQGNASGVALCEAAFNGDLTHIKRLLENGVGINDADYDERTALHLAACEGHVDVVKHLLDARASVASVDRFGG